MEWEEAWRAPSLSPGPRRGASSYLLLLEVQQIRRAHLAVAVSARSCIPARTASSSACSPSTAAAIGLPGEAAHAVLTRGS